MIEATNKKGHRANGSPLEITNTQVQFNAKSTATEAQRTRVFTLSAVEDEGSTFDRLVRQFEQIGLQLYWLNEPSVLVSAPKLGMSLTLPDLRTAKAYLAQVTGQTA